MSEADIRELTKLERDLGQGGARAGREAYLVVAKGAANVKRDWRKNAKVSSGRSARRYPYTITYSPKLAAGAAEFDIGPEARGQGNLGPILEGGSVTSPPHRDGARALEAEAPRFEAALEALAERLLPQ